jgi:hypothetical protein
MCAVDVVYTSHMTDGFTRGHILRNGVCAVLLYLVPVTVVCGCYSQCQCLDDQCVVESTTMETVRHVARKWSVSQSGLD